MLTDQQQIHGSAWLELADHTKITYRIEPDATVEFADFHFFGAVELGLSMSKATIRRCRDLFDKALAELDSGSITARTG